MDEIESICVGEGTVERIGHNEDRRLESIIVS